MSDSGGGARPDEVRVRNVLSGSVDGPVVMAGTIHGGVHIHERSPRPARSVWAVGDLSDPFAFEVHRPIAVGGALDSVLPPYIERDHDAVLRAAARRAAGGTSASAVLVGSSSTGKTRACWEALRALPDGWRLWHPIAPGRPEALVDGLDEVTPHTVLWLDETQHYLLTPGSDLGERCAALLRELLRDPRRSPVLVLGTMWPEHWSTLTTTPRRNAEDPHPQARSLLAGAAVPVAGAFDARALAALRAAASRDPRLAAAAARAEDGQITQFIAGVPALLDRHRTAPPGARALIDAAGDARRLGHGLALSRSLLVAAAPGYLSDRLWNELDDGWPDEALRYATESCRGAAGPLTRIRPRQEAAPGAEPHYLLADYLLQEGRAGRTGAPAQLWDALLAHGAREDLTRLGFEAGQSGLRRYACSFFVAAAEAGDPFALASAADMLAPTGQGEAVREMRRRAAGTAATAARRAAEEGNISDLSRAAAILEQAGRGDEAHAALHTGVERSLKRAVSERLSVPPMGLLDLVSGSARADELLAWARERADAGDEVALRYAYYLGLRTSPQAAERWLRERADAGIPEAAVLARPGRERVGDTEAALRYALTAAGAGDVPSMAAAASLLQAAGRDDEALEWYRRAAERGVPDALVACARLFGRRGEHATAFQYYRQAIDTGDPRVLVEAARDLQGDRLEDALRLLIDRAHRGDTEAAGRVAWLYERAGRGEEAVAWLYERADRGDVDALSRLANLLERRGRVDEAIACYQRVAEAGRHEEWGAALMERLGRTQELVAWLREGARRGKVLSFGCLSILEEAGYGHETERIRRHQAETWSGGAHSLAAWLRTRQREAEAERVERWGIEPGGRTAGPWAPPPVT